MPSLKEQIAVEARSTAVRKTDDSKKSYEFTWAFGWITARERVSAPKPKISPKISCNFPCATRKA